MPFLRRLFGLTAFSVPTAGGGWFFYTRNTTFVPFTPNDAAFSPAFKRINPSGNPPVCIDHAIRRVPLSQLKTTKLEELTTDFCRGIWGGLGYWYQRRFLEKKYRALQGRQDHLWDRQDLAVSNYPMGTVITDHFEVISRSPGEVTVRCGDTPFTPGLRPSDGIFSMEVTIDKESAIFHLKSVFVNTTADGKNSEPLPWHWQWAHRQYTKLWMETSVRRLLK